MAWSSHDSAWARWGRAVIAVWIGVIALTDPDRIARAIVVLVGLYLLYAGLTELFRLLGLNVVADDREARTRSAHIATPLRIASFAALFLAGTSLAAGVIIGLGPFDRGPESPFEDVDTGACNDHAELCDRRLDEVTLAATHNSMSAVNDGWLFAAHRGGVAAQLEAGVRGLLVDVWHGFETDNGVRTELLTGDRDQLIEEYGLELVEARDRIAATLGVEGRRDLFLCHGFCELGATPFAETLADLRRFLVTHPRDVVVLVIQDEAPPEAIAAAIADADLARFTYSHPEPAAPWPTLGELIESGRTLIVMAEGGATPEPWFHDAFALTQETPFAFATPEELSCVESRGDAGRAALPRQPLDQRHHPIAGRRRPAERARFPARTPRAMPGGTRTDAEPRRRELLRRGRSLSRWWTHSTASRNRPRTTDSPSATHGAPTRKGAPFGAPPAVCLGRLS